MKVRSESFWERTRLCNNHLCSLVEFQLFSYKCLCAIRIKSKILWLISASGALALAGVWTVHSSIMSVERSMSANYPIKKPTKTRDELQSRTSTCPFPTHGCASASRSTFRVSSILDASNFSEALLFSLALAKGYRTDRLGIFRFGSAPRGT